MAFADVLNHLAPNLQIPLNGKTYQVKPPSKRDGLIMAAFIATGMNNVFGAKNAPEDIALLESLEPGVPIAVYSLGKDVYDEMVADRVPDMHLDQAAVYAMYFWCLGEEQADESFKLVYAAAAEGDLPKDSRLLKIGPNTGSANQTKTGSTPGTRSRQNPKDRLAPSAKKAASRGSKSSNPGPTSSKTSPSTTK